MHQQLKEKLWAYIVHNNPDEMFRLQDEYNVVRYLEEKVSAVMPTALRLLEEGRDGHAIHELCLNEMTADLKPSRFHYITTILNTEFEQDYTRLRESGLLTYEAVNLIAHCKATFDALHFSEATVDDSKTYYAITGQIQEYLQEQKTKAQ
ncbi:DUF1896 family protein [Sphingobacterium sp. MYb388]